MRTRVFSIAFAVFSAAPGFAADPKAGQTVYDKSCKSCHGADGTPNAAIAKMLKVEMRDLKAAGVQARSDVDLKKVIVDGEGKMKPTAGVSSASADDMVAYVRTLKK